MARCLGAYMAVIAGSAIALVLLSLVHVVDAEPGSCPIGDSACATGCCPTSDGVCCGNSHCCPSGYTCSNGNMTCVANEPEKHPLATWQPQWPVCEGPFPLETMEKVVVNLGFNYYSSGGNIDAMSNTEYRAVVIMQHGAGRNAGEYFCTGNRTRFIQEEYSPEQVLVLAPWFMQPQDNPPSGIVYWSGEDDNGVWRSGEQSEPSADSEGRTISSYAIYDRMIQTLLKADKFPHLHLIALVGHSSGGQLVQRYAFSHKINVDASPAVHVRFLVANPSSYVYLDSRRWFDGELKPTPESVRQSCPDFNNWQWGLAGSFPPYVSPPSKISQYGKRYATLDLVYMAGLNDTCNENIVPGCHSHGLETTCMDMLEGLMRLDRTKNYKAFVDKYYGAPTHKLVVVPNSNHDHTLMFESPEGLEAIYDKPSVHSRGSLPDWMGKSPAAMYAGIFLLILVVVAAWLYVRQPKAKPSKSSYTVLRDEDSMWQSDPDAQ